MNRFEIYADGGTIKCYRCDRPLNGIPQRVDYPSGCHKMYCAVCCTYTFFDLEDDNAEVVQGTARRAGAVQGKA